MTRDRRTCGAAHRRCPAHPADRNQELIEARLQNARRATDARRLSSGATTEVKWRPRTSPTSSLAAALSQQDDPCVVEVRSWGRRRSPGPSRHLRRLLEGGAGRRRQATPSISTSDRKDALGWSSARSSRPRGTGTCRVPSGRTARGRAARRSRSPPSCTSHRNR